MQFFLFLVNVGGSREKNLQREKKKSENILCHSFRAKGKKDPKNAQIFTLSPKIPIADYMHYVN